MQIGSVGRVCMLHVTVHELSILFATDNNIGKIHTSLLSTTIKIFSHISKVPSSSDSCLAQLSFNLEQSIHLDLNGNHPLIQKTSVYVNQPEIIFYENLSINVIHALLFPRVQTNEDEIKTHENFSEVSSHSKEINFSKIPLEMEFKVRTFTIKLMREGGKRILSIDLKSVESNVERRENLMN
ncbi:uncharacterized protein [Centruroides vittatus]|uniref:uncharacterized protein n=1 Tax=Centruroides vittatus TaxID=120091 RepID=UPI003510ABD1